MERHFKSYKKPHVSNISRSENDPIVQNDLAITPAQMMELTQKGLAISNQNAQLLREQLAPERGYDVPMEFRRHVDILADGYQAQQEFKNKFRSFVEVSELFKSNVTQQPAAESE